MAAVPIGITKKIAISPIPFKLTQPETVLLETDLERRLSKFENVWYNNMKATLQMIEDTKAKKRQSELLRDDNEFDLDRCVREAGTVLKEVTDMIGFVGVIRQLVDMRDADGGSNIGDLLDQCVKYVDETMDIKYFIQKSSADLKKTCDHHGKTRRHGPKSRQTDPGRDQSQPMIRKVRSYRRLIKMNGGTRSKFTSESNVRGLCKERKEKAPRQMVQHPPPPPMISADNVMLESRPEMD